MQRNRLISFVAMIVIAFLALQHDAGGQEITTAIRDLQDATSRVTRLYSASEDTTQTLQVRSEIVKELIRSNPQAAISGAIGAEEREKYLSQNPGAEGYLETSFTEDGVLRSFTVDDFKNGTSEVQWKLQTSSGVVDIYPVSGVSLTPLLQKRVTVQGLRVGNIAAVSSVYLAQLQSSEISSNNSDSETDPYCKRTGNQRVAVIYVNFPNGNNIETVKSEFSAAYNGSEPSLSDYWKVVSRGQTSLSADFFGPYLLDKTYTCDENDDMFAAAIAASKSDIDFSKYDRYTIVFGGESSCRFAGAALTSCMNSNYSTADKLIGHGYSEAWINVNGIATPLSDNLWGVLAHEHGHNLTLDHANFLNFHDKTLGMIDYAGDSNSYQFLEYSDLYSVMGVPRAGGPYHSVELTNRLAWLQHDEVIQVDSPGTYKITPIEIGKGASAMRIQRDEHSGAYVWLEYHQPVDSYIIRTGGTYAGATGDVGLVKSHNLFSGVLGLYEEGLSLERGGRLSEDNRSALINFAPESISNSMPTLPTLLPGTSWVDPYTPLNIKVNSADNTGISVSVGYDSPCATLTLSNDGIYEKAAGGGTLWVSAPEGCSWNVSTASSWITFGAALSGSGNATIPFTLSENTSTRQRLGYIAAARQSIPVIQESTGVTIRKFNYSVIDDMTDDINIRYSVVSENWTGAQIQLQIQSEASTDQDLSNLCGFVIYQYKNMNGGGMVHLDANQSAYLGTNVTVSNQFCSIDVSHSSLTVDGRFVDLKLRVKFSEAFRGGHTVRASAGLDGSGQLPDYLPIGTIKVSHSLYVDVPVISIADVVSSNAKQVSIKTATSNALIYYTIDGTVPSKSSLLYSAPITLDHSVVITARAFAGSMEPSHISKINCDISTGGSASNVSVTPSSRYIYRDKAYTVSVAITPSSSSIPTGTVTLKGGGYLSSQAIGVAPCDTYSSCVFSMYGGNLSLGDTQLIATYSGNSAYASSTGSAPITVLSPGSVSVTWATPAAIVYGTALSSTQLNATASVPGTFVYNPAVGKVLSAGTQTLSVTFTPTDTTSYSSVTKTVTLIVQDFTVPASTPTLSLSAGQSGTSDLTISSASGFTGLVTFTCSVPSSMSEASCSVASVQVPATGQATTTLTVTTTAQHTLAYRATENRWSGLAGICLSFLVLGLPAYRFRRAGGLYVLLAVLTAFGMVSCGGGGSTGTSTQKTDAGTPSGTYTLAIKATSGTATHDISATVTVK